MRELYVFCEGSTEQGFCSRVIAPYLFPQHDGHLHTIRVANGRNRGVVSRGGIQRYSPLKRDIKNTLKSRSQPNVFFTSLIDLYGLPADFPGKASCVRDPNNPAAFALALESAFGADVDDARFIPHLQLHEFETVLFANPDAFRIAFDDCDSAIGLLIQIARSFRSIEFIDDGPDTAPSKRIIDAIPGYEGRKASAGPDIAEFIGVRGIRDKCSHFDQWLTRLENINWKSG